MLEDLVATRSPNLDPAKLLEGLDDLAWLLVIESRHSLEFDDDLRSNRIPQL